MQKLSARLVGRQVVLDVRAKTSVDLEQWDVAQEAPLFLGRCVAALAMDPDLFEKSGGSYTIDELAAEYRFTHPDHT